MKLFKRLSAIAIIGFLALSISSCLNTDDNNSYTIDGFLSATAIDVNSDSIQPVGQVTNVHITFKTTNSCQQFVGFRSLTNSSATDTIHNIGVYGTQSNAGGTCLDQVKSVTKTFKFTPRKAGKNTIRVLAGVDPVDNTKNVYIEKTLDIVN